MVEQFPPLLAVPGLRHAFVGREPAVTGALTTDRDAALAALRPAHVRACEDLGFPWEAVATVEQVHGDGVCVVERDEGGSLPGEISGADGLVFRGSGVLLGIYVADCAAVALVDPRRRAVGLVHSGKSGSELGIVRRAVGRMVEAFGTDPGDLIVHLGPCIRPPFYETDIPALVRADALGAGVLPVNYHDCGLSTAEHLDRYYSYRMEKGATGRMLVLLGWAD